MKTASFALVALVVVALVGCGGPKTARFSGFLGDYAGFEPSRDSSQSFRYEAPGFDLGDYDKIMLDPVRIHLAPDSNAASVDPAQMNRLVKYFERQIRGELAGKYPVVRQGGPGVLRLRIAITDVKQTDAVFNVLPQTKLSGVGLGGASMEAEAIDTKTGQRVVAVVETKAGDQLDYGAGLTEWGHAENVMKYWAKRLVERLDEAHGR